MSVIDKRHRQLVASIFFGAIFGLLMIVANPEVVPDTSSSRSVDGAAEIMSVGKLLFPVLIDSAGNRYSCVLRVCHVQKDQIRSGVPAKGRVAIDGTLIELETQDATIYGPGIFEGQQRKLKLLSIVLVVTILLSGFFTFKWT